jgi:hypothetical protein
MSDFSIYKGLKLSELTSNSQFSTTGTGSGQQNSGAANAVAQSCMRFEKMKVANLSATTSESTEGEACPWPFQSILRTANITVPGTGNAVANTTDYSKVTLFKRTGNGAAVTMATANLSNVAVTQWIPVAFTLVANAANYTIAAGDVISANVALTGNGTANNLAVMVDLTAEDV